MELSRKTVAFLKKLGFQGTDANLEISLFEYDFIFRPSPDGTPDEYQIIYYRPGLDRFVVFGWTFVSLSDVLDCFKQEKESLLSCTGETEEQWLDLPLEHQISDIVNTVSWFDWSYATMNKGDLSNFGKPHKSLILI